MKEEETFIKHTPGAHIFIYIIAGAFPNHASSLLHTEDMEHPSSKMIFSKMAQITS